MVGARIRITKEWNKRPNIIIQNEETKGARRRGGGLMVS